MKKALLNFFNKIEPSKEKQPFLHTIYDGFFTFAFTPNFTTRDGVHIRDGMDLKRTMVFVVLALQLCYLFGTWNIGQQHFAALGLYPGYFDAFHLKIAYGLIQILPIFIVTHVVGLGIEFYFAYRKGHGIEEGFLVSGALIPLIMPPDIPLWILAISVAFAVWIGKEAFGGTGMNIMNIALLARVFVFFAYPTYISGDEVWIAGLEKAADGTYSSASYGFGGTFFDWIFSGVGWQTFGEGGALVADSYTGATPLGLGAKGGWEAITSAGYTLNEMWWGVIPGSIGETSKPLILIGAIFLVFAGIASWRIMVSAVVGAAVMALILNGLAPAEITEETPNIFKFMAVPWYYQFYMGSFFFAMAFMATDPVTASSTTTGKWIYGFFIGFVGMLIRIMNPAYPEGWMLAILFMNVFAPLIDHYVLQANISRRQKRTKLAVATA